MLTTITYRLCIPFVFTLVISGCSAGRTIESAGRFATAGIAYTDSIPAVIDESFELAVMANSLTLSQTRENRPGKLERANLLAQHDEELEVRLALLRDLKRHAKLLRSYFIALRSITQTDAAAGITEATQSLVDRMTELRPEIAEASVGGISISDLIAPAVELAVGAYQGAVLESELEERGPVIERELELQRAVLKAISEQMISDRDLQLQVEERNPLVIEFARPIHLP